MTAPGLEAVADLLSAAVTARVTPGAVVQTGSSAGPRWTIAAGHVTYAADAALVTPATVYDLASLTKVLATATLAMRHAAAGTLPLDATTLVNTQADRASVEWRRRLREWFDAAPPA